jgi:arylsulfatase A-like enzyme
VQPVIANDVGHPSGAKIGSRLKEMRRKQWRRVWGSSSILSGRALCGWANASNTPFRLYKHWVHEGGIAAPFIARWPNQIKRHGQFFREPAHISDIMPTVLELAGGTYPHTYRGNSILPMAGKSLVPIFRGKVWSGHGPMYWEHEGNRAVRHGKWKLVSRYPDKWELYDMKADRSEIHDLAAKEQERVKQMTALYEAWAEKMKIMPGADLMNRLKEKQLQKMKPLGRS